jgi:insertion element IS1 protein InsB
VLATHADEAFLQLKALLEPFGIMQFYSDGWGAYERHIEPVFHTVGKLYTQKIERKHLTLRTRIKRLARKTICFSNAVFSQLRQGISTNFGTRISSNFGRVFLQTSAGVNA